MTDAEYQETLERIKVIAGTCYSMITEDEIRNIIKTINSHISVYQYDKLIRECKEYVQVVSMDEKQRAIRAANPDAYKEPEPDPILIDKFFCILLEREMDPDVRTCWENTLDMNVNYHIIRMNRLAVHIERLLAELGVSLEELYYLEREMIKLYYLTSDNINKSKNK